MANTLQIKRGSGTPGSLAAGELGVDVSAKKLYSSDGSSVFQIGSAGAPGVVSLTADGAITAGDTVSLTDEGKVKRTRTDGYGSVDANVDNYYTFQDLDHSSSFAVAYDARRDLAVIGYRDPDNSGYYTTQVLRVTSGGTEFSFGKPTVVYSGSARDSSMVYCEGEGRFLLVYQDASDSDKGKAQILDVAAFGKDDHDAATHEYRVVGQSEVNAFTSGGDCLDPAVAWDVGLQRIVVAYSDATDGYLQIGQIVSSSLPSHYPSFGTRIKIHDAAPLNRCSIATNGSGKGLIFFADEGNSNYGSIYPFNIDEASDLTPTAGSLATMVSYAVATAKDDGAGENILYDPHRNQFYFAFFKNSDKELYIGSVTLDDWDTNKATVIKGSSAASNWGQSATGHGATLLRNPLDCTYMVAWGENSGTDGRIGQLFPGYRQNTDENNDEEHVISNIRMAYLNGFYHEKSHRTILFSASGDSKDHLAVHSVRATESNADQFFGIAQADISTGTAGNIIPYGSIDEVNGGLSAICGPTCRFGNRFDAEEFAGGSAVYDSTNDAVVIFYQDSGNSNYGTAVVGKVDPINNTISFGTPVAFNSSTTSFTANSSVYDPDAGRVVAFYTVSNKGYAIVGNVSNNTISFGTAVQFNGTDNVYEPSTAYDTNTDRIGVFYSNNNASLDGAVATVTAGTNAISFGSATAFYNPSADASLVHNAVFMNSHNKIFVNYGDPDNSNRGTGIVATITGGTTNSVAFGTAANYNTNGPDHANNSIAVWDSTNNKLCIFFENEADSDRASLVVATVSGTTISYGSILDYDLARTANASEYKGSFDSDTGNILFMCRHTNQEVNQYPGYQQTAFVARVSGTSAIVSRQISGTTGYHYANLVYDSTSKRHVEFGKLTNTEWGTGKTSAFDPSYAKVWQVGFIPGEDHYVQGSGAIIAADKHQSNLKSTLIKAGVGLSKTKILLKGAKYG